MGPKLTDDEAAGLSAVGAVAPHAAKNSRFWLTSCQQFVFHMREHAMMPIILGNSSICLAPRIVCRKTLY